MSKNISTLVNAAMAYNERAQASRLVDSWSEETAKEYQGVTARLLKEATALQGKEQTANSNPDSSPEGRFKAMKREVQPFIGGLRWLRDEKGALETKVGNLFGELFILPPSTRTDQALRDGEIRGALWPLPIDERNNQYLRSSESDQVEILRALIDAPLALISDEVRMRGDDARAARLQPSLYRKFIESGELLDEITVILQDALSLGAEFGLDTPPVVDELGPRIRASLDFAVDHAKDRGKKVLHTLFQDAVVAPSPTKV